MVTEKDYNKVIKLIESIGYEKHVGSCYIIQDDGGYVNIEHLNFDLYKRYIVFHKNHYYSLGRNDIFKTFLDYDSFEKYIFEYHSKLFLKHKLNKITRNINNV